MIGLVERATELHQVMTLLEGAREGTGGLLVLEGAAGIGKTTILREAAAIAARRASPSRVRPVTRSRPRSPSAWCASCSSLRWPA